MQHDEHRRLTSPRYRITYGTSYVVLLIVGLCFFSDSEDWIERVANICVAAAGIAFALAEVTEGTIVIGQAIREIVDARRQKREEALIERGRKEERERLRREGRLRDEGDDSPRPAREQGGA